MTNATTIIRVISRERHTSHQDMALLTVMVLVIKSIIHLRFLSRASIATLMEYVGRYQESA